MDMSSSSVSCHWETLYISRHSYILSIESADIVAYSWVEVERRVKGTRHEGESAQM